jgi:hypothetical protein
MNYLPELALNHDSPGLCLLSSCDYRREPLMQFSKLYKGTSLGCQG